MNEALHLSEREREMVVGCFLKIRQELEHAIDRHSKRLIAINIEMLLDYCLRFYERQFITRSNVNHDILPGSNGCSTTILRGIAPSAKGCLR